MPAPLATRLTRSTCAVLVADVVGFSRLMEEDEEDTYKRLHVLRTDVIGPGVKRHGGHVVKETGDGFIAAFDDAGAPSRSRRTWRVGARGKQRRGLSGSAWACISARSSSRTTTSTARR
jgi:class 3 adenylate cyclase